MNADRSSWPAGPGEMAGRIRDFDWGSSPLGPVERWSPCIRSMVEVVLATPMIASIVVGPGRILLYNDAAARLYGKSHPRALGRSVLETFRQEADAIEALHERAFDGESIVVPAQSVALAETDVDATFESFLTPVRDGSGDVVAVYMVGYIVDDRLRAERSLRESEGKYRSVFNTIDEGLCLVELLYDDQGAPYDYRFVEVNPAFERQTGLTGVAGRTCSDILDHPELDLLHLYADIVASGEPQRFQTYDQATDRRYEAYASRVDGRDQPCLCIVFTDVTDRRRAEEFRRASELRQAFLLDLADALRPLTDAMAIQRTATRLLAAHLAADQAYYGEVVGAEVVATAHEDTGPTTRRLRLAELRGDLLDRCTAGQTTTCADSGDDRPGGGTDSRYRAHVTVPLVKRGEWGAMLAVSSIAPRAWTSAEISLVEDAAERIWDAVERARAESALRASERFSRALVEGVPQLVWRAVDGGEWTWASPQWTIYTGQAEADSHETGWLAPVHPDDRARTMARWRRATDRGAFQCEYRLYHTDEGRYRWFQTRATPVRDEAGDVVEWLGTSTDIDDLRSLQERQSILVGELQHRTFNLMGMIRSMADATVRSSNSLADFTPKFRNRIDALARVQRLLSRLKDDERVMFDEVVRNELEAVGALPEENRAVALSGPAGVALRSSTVQTLAMAIHELVTNAMKHGALSQPDARLSVSWQLEAGQADEPMLHIEWRETGVTGLADKARQPARGQGRTLIEIALPFQLDARTTYSETENGISCSITIPVSSRSRAIPEPRHAFT